MTAKEMPDLLPCPFCGGMDIALRDVRAEEDGRPYAKAYWCRDCHCVGRHNHRIGWSECKVSARESWNTRAPPVPRDHFEDVRKPIDKQAALDALHTLCLASEPCNEVMDAVRTIRAALQDDTKKCQKGEDCDQTIAYMVGFSDGAQSQHDTLVKALEARPDPYAYSATEHAHHKYHEAWKDWWFDIALPALEKYKD